MDSKNGQETDGDASEKRSGIGYAWRQKKGWFWFGALLTFFVILIASSILAYFVPRDYPARVQLEVMRESQTYEVFPAVSTRDERPFEDHETFMRTEITKISSKETLYRVVDGLQLVKKWDFVNSPSEAYDYLKEHIKVEAVSDSSIVGVTVTHDAPQEAADLANAIAQAYNERRTRDEFRRQTNALDMLNAQETLQEQKVEDARQRMIELMEKFDIVDLGTDTSTTAGLDAPLTASREIMMQHESLAAIALSEAAAIQTEFETVAGLNHEERLLWFQQNGKLAPHEMEILGEWDKLQLKLATIPEVEDSDVPTEEQATLPQLRREEIAVRERLERMEKGHLSLMQVRFEIAKEKLNRLRDIVNDKRDQILDERKKYTQYVEARRAFEMQSKVLQAMRESLLQGKVNLSLPRSPVTIHEIAEATEQPASARVQKELKTAAITGALWAIPGGLVCMYLALAFSGLRDYEYVYESIESVDEDAVPEAVEVTAEEDSSPY